MGFFDALLGRLRPAAPDLDALFALPGAAVGIEAATGRRPTGGAAVAFKPATGASFAAAEQELDELLELSAQRSGSQIDQQADRYGYRWITVRDPDVEDLVGTVHLVNRTLTDRGFGPRLLCSVFAFDTPEGEHRSAGHEQAPSGHAGPVYLVYLYKRGTFYPFAPRGHDRRDGEVELRLRGLLADELPVEDDLSRWWPVWGVPVR